MRRLLTILIALPLLAGFSPLTTPTDKGNAAYNAGKYDEARDAYQKAAEDNPGKAEAHYNLGGAYFKKGDYNQALKEYEEAIKLNPKMAEAYYNAGDSLYRLGRFDDALKAFRQADSLKEKDPDTEHNIAVTLRKVKEEQKKQKSGPTQGRQGQGGDMGQQGRGQPSGGQNAAGEGSATGRIRQGQPRMSNEEVQAMLDRQAREEKNLRNYFRPGKKDQAADREAQIEQILRGAGLTAPSARRAVRPGAPQVEKNW